MAGPSSATKLRALLHAGHQLRYTDICDRTDIGSTRQAKRLVDRLIEEGLPVREKRSGRAKVFYLKEEDQAKEVVFRFDEEEMLALAVSAEAAKAALGGTPLQDPIRRAFRKLLDNLAPHAVTFEMEEMHAQYIFNSSPLNHIDLEIFKALQLAIKERQTICIDYHSASSNRRSQGRKIDPLAIALPGKSWLLVAYCHASRRIKDFAIAAIGGVDMPRDAPVYFDYPDNFDRETYFVHRFGSLEDNRILPIRLLVEADRAAYFRRKKYHTSQQIEEERPDGRIVVSFTVSGLDEVRSFVQSWGSGITVLDPPELKARIVEELQLLNARYT